MTVKSGFAAGLFALGMTMIAIPQGAADATGQMARDAQPQEQAQAAFETLLEDHWASVLEANPTFATSLGERAYDDRLGSVSLTAHDARMARSERFLDRLAAIDRAALTAEDQTNYDLLQRELKTTLEGDAFGGKYLVMTNRNGPHTFLTRLPDRLPFFTLADYESYIARLGDMPRYLREARAVMGAGIDAGWTQPCKPMEGVSESIRFHLVDDAAESVFLKPFETRPGGIDADDWKRLEKAARKRVKDDVLPAIKAYADYYDESYAPACKQSVGAADYPDGLDYYAWRARQFTTTSETPDEIHEKGLSEVKRIRAEMEKIIEQTGFDGDFKAFQTFLRSDPQFYAKTPEELVAITSTISKRIDGELPKLFTKLPRMPYTVKPVPADIAEGTTTAYYERPAGDGSRAGVYRINTSLLDQRPIYELEALTLHEAVPGHHFQIALAQELDLPPFRAYGGFTAFVEGWGLYAESLGLDVGFYEDPYQNFGRLSYEMWRACRLVVDTGMHAKGWTRQQAIDFMADNTALSEHNVKAEIDRYITWPGQALAYKTGELKIKQLRARAKKALGPDFDLRRFHDAVLENGAVPLSVLENRIDAFIAAELKD